MKPFYPTCLLLWATCFSSTIVVIAQDTTKTLSLLSSPVATADDARKSALLFEQDNVAEFSLTTNLRTLLKDRGEQPTAHAATMICMTDTLPLTLKVRGNFRRQLANCEFPPLLIDFPKKKTRNTLFAHQNKLKLVTHCQVDEWVIREYLVYKLYNLLTDLSFRARLARVTYIDSLGKRPAETHWGMLLEDDDDLAKRNKAKISPSKYITTDFTDSLQMATVAVFEYMIGNTDWSVPYLHNIRLLDNGQQGLLPVPYDFDHAGIVEASYAKPADQLGIVSVRERLYRGLSYPMPLLRQVFDKFNQVKPQCYALYQNDSRLNKSYVKRTLKYLDDFYTFINKPTTAQNGFISNK